MYCTSNNYYLHVPKLLTATKYSFKTLRAKYRLDTIQKVKAHASLLHSERWRHTVKSKIQSYKQDWRFCCIRQTAITKQISSLGAHQIHTKSQNLIYSILTAIFRRNRIGRLPHWYFLQLFLISPYGPKRLICCTIPPRFPWTSLSPVPRPLSYNTIKCSLFQDTSLPKCHKNSSTTFWEILIADRQTQNNADENTIFCFTKVQQIRRLTT